MAVSFFREERGKPHQTHRSQPGLGENWQVGRRWIGALKVAKEHSIAKHRHITLEFGGVV